MKQGNDVPLNYLPLCGNGLYVAMKEVATDNLKELTLGGSSEECPIGDADSKAIAFRQTMEEPNRITIHFRRQWENDSLAMVAACRLKDRDRKTGEMKDGQPFGFSLETKEEKYKRHGQFFLNLVYLSNDKDRPKPEGFEPLYLKVKIWGEDGKPRISYLKISVTRTGPETLNVASEKVAESEAPAPLRAVSFEQPAPQPDSGLVRSFLGSKSR